jgi:hypothetical protein
MITPEYIVGLIDGEGSFTAYVKDFKNSKNVKRRVKAEPRFYIKLIERDKKILYELKNYFGCGHVYFQKDKRANHQNCYRFEVSARRDLNDIIIPFFKKNQLKFPSKQNDFKIFCRLMKMINAGKHLSFNGLAEMLKLKQKMH